MVSSVQSNGLAPSASIFLLELEDRAIANTQLSGANLRAIAPPMKPLAPVMKYFFNAE